MPVQEHLVDNLQLGFTADHHKEKNIETHFLMHCYIILQDNKIKFITTATHFR